MSRPTEAPASGQVPEVGGTVWHALSAERILQAEQVEPAGPSRSAPEVTRA